MLKKKLPNQLSDFKNILHPAFCFLNSQKGFAGQLVMVLLLVVGIGLGTYLTQQRTDLTPKADESQCKQACDLEHSRNLVSCRDQNVCTPDNDEECAREIDACNIRGNNRVAACHSDCEEAASAGAGDNNNSDSDGAGCQGTHSVWGTWNGDQVDVDQDYGEVPGQCGVPDDGSGRPTPGFDEAGNPVSGSASGAGVDSAGALLPPFAGISLGYGTSIDATDFVSRLRRFKAQLSTKSFTNSTAQKIGAATTTAVDKYVKELEACLEENGLSAGTSITVATPNAIDVITKLEACETKARELERALKEDYRLAKFYEILAKFGKNPTNEACVKADLGYKDASLKHLNSFGINDAGVPPEERRLFFCVGGTGHFKWRVNNQTGTMLERVATAEAKLYQSINAVAIPDGQPKVDVVVMTMDEVEKIREGDKNTIQKMFEKTEAMKGVYQRFLKVRDLVSKELGIKFD